MDDKEIMEILDYVIRKYSENVPRPVRFLVRKKSKMIEKFTAEEMPEPLRNTTVEQFISILQDGLKQGTFKL